MEIEAKIPVQNHDAVLGRLAQLDGRRVGLYLETNHLFDDSGGGLRDSGRGLRVRELQCLDGEPRSATMTFKGPVVAGPLKTRPEFETGLVDPLAAIAILEGLGYSRLLTFEKRREVWRLEPCSVELDDVATLGTFVEVEGPDESAVLQTLQALELDLSDHRPDSYIAQLLGMDPSPRFVRF